MSKIVLACDLSLTCPAFAVVKFENGEARVLQKSHVKTNSKKSTGFRLFQIFGHLEGILTSYEIDEFVFEKGFNKFAIATQQIQRTVGVATICIYHYYKESVIHEISPTSVKKLVTGDGKASKEKLAESLGQYVGVLEYKTNDESDAVGVAIALGKQKDWI